MTIAESRPVAPVPEWSDDADPRHQIQVRDLLAMRDGLAFIEEYQIGQTSHVIDMLYGEARTIWPPSPPRYPSPASPARATTRAALEHPESNRGRLVATARTIARTSSSLFEPIG